MDVYGIGILYVRISLKKNPTPSYQKDYFHIQFVLNVTCLMTC